MIDSTLQHNSSKVILGLLRVPLHTSRVSHYFSPRLKYEPLCSSILSSMTWFQRALYAMRKASWARSKAPIEFSWLVLKTSAGLIDVGFTTRESKIPPQKIDQKGKGCYQEGLASKFCAEDEVLRLWHYQKAFRV